MTENELFFKSRESAEYVAKGLLVDGYWVSIFKGRVNSVEGYFVKWRMEV